MCYERRIKHIRPSILRCVNHLVGVQSQGDDTYQNSLLSTTHQNELNPMDLTHHLVLC